MNTCTTQKVLYNRSVTSKKDAIGFDSLKRYRGMKPQRHHSLAAFSLCAPFLAAQMGGAQAPAGFAPRFASLSTRLSRRLCLTADATVVFTNQLEHHMAKITSSASAHITKSLREIDGDISSVTDTISAISWMAQLAIEHTAQIGTTAGVARHFKAIFELIQCQAEMLGNDMDCKVSELCESLAGEAA